VHGGYETDLPIPGDMITPEHIMFKTIREVARPRLRSCLRASPGRWSRGQGPCSGGPLTRCPPLGWRSKAVTGIQDETISHADIYNV